MLEVKSTDHRGRIRLQETAETDGAYRFVAIGAMPCLTRFAGRSLNICGV